MAFLLRRNAIIPGVIPKDGCAVLKERSDLGKTEVFKLWDAECRNGCVRTNKVVGRYMDLLFIFPYNFTLPPMFFAYVFQSHLNPSFYLERIY